MRRCNLLGGAALVVAFWSFIPANAGVTLGQTDTFQTTDALGWTMGPSSPLLPAVISTGGPQGANDGFVQLISTGTGHANSRVIMYNTNQWAGDYVAAGVTRINAEICDFGPNPLSMRVAFQDSFAIGEVASTVAVAVPADSQWHAVTFDVTPSALTLVQGTSSISQVLTNVGEFRLLSNSLSQSIIPWFMGEPLAATVGFDDVTAVPEPAFLAPLLGTILLRRKRLTSTPTSAKPR